MNASSVFAERCEMTRGPAGTLGQLDGIQRLRSASRLWFTLMSTLFAGALGDAGLDALHVGDE